MPGEPRRVLLTADAVGGVWTHALDLARGLSGRGIEVLLALLGPPPSPAQRAEAEAVPALLLVETGLPLDWTAPDPGAVLGAGASLARLARDERVDLVHLHAPALAAEASFGRPVLATAHSCVGTWWAAMRGSAPLPPDLAWRRDLVARGCRRVDGLLAPSAAFARATAALYGLPEPLVVPNGREPPAREPAARDASEPVPAFTAGRLWDEGKNVAALDRAAARLGRPVLAAGPLTGPNGAAIAVRHLRALGPLAPDALAARLAARPVFASPAFYEPFGLAVLEAAGAGCPLVLSDIPTFRELWEGAARFVRPEDDAALAAAIEAVAGDPALGARMGEAARRRAGRFGLAPFLEGTLAAYRRAAEGARSAA